MIEYTSNERKEIYKKMQIHCIKHEKLEIKFVNNLIKKYALKEVEEKNRLNKINEVIEYSLINKKYILNIKRIIFSCIEALTEYEYFNSVKEDKKDYIDENLHKQLIDNLKFYSSDTKISIKLPQHPNDIVRSLYIELIQNCNLNKYIVKKILKIIFPNIRKITYSKNTQNQLFEITKKLEQVIDTSTKATDKVKEEHLKKIQKLKKTNLTTHR